MIRIICALVCSAVVFIASGRTASARDNLPIGYTAITGIKAGLWVAEEAGIFEKYSIQPHLILITSGSKMVQAMLGGDLPLAGAAGNAAVDAALAGADIVMIGALAKVPAFYIMALPEIKSIEDLRGKAVGVTRFGSSTDHPLSSAQARVKPGSRRYDDSGRRPICCRSDAQDQGHRRGAVFQPDES
jgi:NitT/TauT family transport system substrate-binding protein